MKCFGCQMQNVVDILLYNTLDGCVKFLLVKDSTYHLFKFLQDTVTGNAFVVLIQGG